MEDHLSISVIIATIARPDVLRTCLEHVMTQDHPPEEVIVVDASADVRSRTVAGDFPHVVYLRNESGLGSLTESRQIGFNHATSDIVAYIDDDAFPEPQWSRELVAAYDAPDVGAVCGRVKTPNPFPPDVEPDQIGRLGDDGRMTGNFFAGSDGLIDVDHAMGANMSYRREVLQWIGGVPGITGGNSNHHEDLAISLAVRNEGFRIRFAAKAAVFHLGAPQPKGRRFDLRYDYFASRNLVLVLRQAFGRSDRQTRSVVRRYSLLACQGTARSVVGAITHFVAAIAGLLVGLLKPVERTARGGTPHRDAPNTDQRPHTR